MLRSEIAQVQGMIDDAVAKVSAEVNQLKAEIAELKAKPEPAKVKAVSEGGK